MRFPVPDRRFPNLRNCGFAAPEYAESAIIDALIREFSVLMLPGALEVEVNKYVKDRLKSEQFELHSVSQDTAFTSQRLELLRQDLGRTSDHTHLEHYIENLSKELHSLEVRKAELEKKCILEEVDGSSMEIIAVQLQRFIRDIRAETPEVQYHLLHSYVEKVNMDDTTHTIMITYNISSGDGSGELLRKQLYVHLN